MESDLRVLAEQRADRKIKFLKNLEAYVIVNAFLALINAFFSPEFWWVMFPVFFWGIGVFVDFLKAYVFSGKFETESYREHKIQKELEKLRN